MSILGFSIVGNPKMTFIFVLGYPYPRRGALRGRVGGIEGVLSPIITNIMCYVNSGVFNIWKSKNDPNPCKGALRGWLGGLQGVLSPIQPNIMCYVNSGVFNSGKSKNDLYFHFKVPQPPQGRP